MMLCQILLYSKMNQPHIYPLPFGPPPHSGHHRAFSQVPCAIYQVLISYLFYVCVQSLSCVRLFATLWTLTCQAPLSMRFFRQEYWNTLPFPSPGYLPDPGIEHVSPVFPALQADSLPAEPLMTEVALFIPLNYLVQCNPPISCVSLLSQPLLILHEGKQCGCRGAV